MKFTKLIEIMSAKKISLIYNSLLILLQFVMKMKHDYTMNDIHILRMDWNEYQGYLKYVQEVVGWLFVMMIQMMKTYPRLFARKTLATDVSDDASTLC